jgi:NTE family protein
MTPMKQLIRRWTIGALGLLTLLTAAAAQADGGRIGLVLGGGGARGAAHIGVLKVLERERIPIHAIAGTSGGAIIGGMYAAGYSPDEIDKTIRSIDWADIFRDATSRPDLPMRQKETDLGSLANLEIGVVNGRLTIPTTLVRGQKLGLFLQRIFLGRSNVKSFDDLPIPFRCVATDIGIVQPVVFRSGDLELAIRASMAVPGAFGPVHHDGKVLVDGGIVDNVPIDVARQMGVDHLIVVDVGQPLAPAESVKTSIDVLIQMISGLMRDRTAASLQKIGPDDVLLRPQLGELTNAGFLQAASGIDAGETAAEAIVASLRKFSVSEAEYTAWRQHQLRRPALDPRISFVKVNEDSSATSAYIRDRITAESGKPFDIDAFENDISGAFGRGTYDVISYRLTTDEAGRTGLEVSPVDSSLGRTIFRLGLQVSDDFDGRDDYQLNLEGRVTGLSSKGAEWRTLVGLGRLSGFATDYYLPFAERGNWFVDPGVGYSALNQPVVINSDAIRDFTLAEYRVESWFGELRVGRDFSDRFRLSAAAVRGQDNARLKIGDLDLPRTQFANLGGLSFAALWDSLDNVRFPNHGTRAELSYTSYDRHLGSDEDGNLLRFAFDTALSSGANTVLLGARASVSKDQVDAFQTQSSLGGLAYLSGLGERELLDNQQMLLRAIYYRRLNQGTSFLSVPTYLAGTLEGGNVWQDYDDVSLDDLIGAASVFLGVDLPIGPLQLGYGRTFDGRGAFYLTFGSLVLPRYR